MYFKSIVDDIKYYAEYMSSFITQLGDDIDLYYSYAHHLNDGYLRYNNNETFIGRAAEASKNFIIEIQGDELHLGNLDIKKEFFNVCLQIEEAFQKSVDSSSKARISIYVLKKIRKDYEAYETSVYHKGNEIKCRAERLVHDYSKWGISEIPTYIRCVLVFEEISGSDGLLKSCIIKLKDFDQYACDLLNNGDFITRAQKLRDRINYIANGLNSMTVYQPIVPKTTVRLMSLGTNKKAMMNSCYNSGLVWVPFMMPNAPIITDEEIANLARITGEKASEIKQLVLGYIPHTVSNETVILVMDYLSRRSAISNKVIKRHEKDNLNQIAEVYSPGDYIENQMAWEKIKYGNKDMAYSGCEIIAVINALHSMGKDLSEKDVAKLISGFEGNGAVLNGTWGTSPLALVDYLQKNTKYNINYTASDEYGEIEEIGKNSDTIIVTLYNDKDDISQEVHTINIEKRIDDKGNVKFVGHNTGYYDDVNGNNNGKPDPNEWIPSIEYSSLEAAIRDASHINNSSPIMVIGISEPALGDFPEGDTKSC